MSLTDGIYTVQEKRHSNHLEGSRMQIRIISVRKHIQVWSQNKENGEFKKKKKKAPQGIEANTG